MIETGAGATLNVMPRTRTATPRGTGPTGGGAAPATVEGVLEMIDAARKALAPHDVAVVLTVLARETDLLLRGALPARPRGRLREGRPSVSPAARAYLRPIRIALADIARTPPGRTPAELAALGARIARHAGSGSGSGS